MLKIVMKENLALNTVLFKTTCEGLRHGFTPLTLWFIFYIWGGRRGSNPEIVELAALPHYQ
jgi:hypothetical protein